MRILSLNAWGGRLHERLIPYLAAADADVICLQEVVRTRDAPAPWLIYRDRDIELPQRANLFEEVSAALPAHDAFFFPAAAGFLFDGNKSVRSEFGLATFVRRNLPIIGQALDFVHGAFSADGWGKHPRPRNAHCMKLHDGTDSVGIVIAQFHGLRDPDGKTDTPERERQANELAGLVARLWKPGQRLVVCGDFNVMPDSATFDILSELELADLVTGRGFTDTRTSFYRKQNRFADYALVTPQVEVCGFDVVETPEVSDHRALVVDVA